MNLPSAPDRYDRATMQSTLRQVELADSENHKRERDVEVGRARLILRSPSGKRFSVVVSDTGVLSAVAL